MFANPVIGQDKSNPLKLEVEADLISYLFKGYSIHAAVCYGNFRSSIGAFAIQQPNFFVSDDNFTVYSQGFDIKTDYLFGEHKGWHAGLQVGYGKDRIGLKDTPEEMDLWGFSFGVRSGYRFMLGKREKEYSGFYINPWIAIIYVPDARTVKLADKAFTQSAFSPFPTVHLGWRF